MTVPADVPGGRYRLPLRITYEYNGDERERDTVRPTVVVPRRPIFAVNRSAEDLRVGESGTVNLSIENEGSLPANRTAITVRSTHPGLTFDRNDAVTLLLGRIEPGELRSVFVEVTAADDANVRAYPLEVRPTYRDRNGLKRTAPAESVEVGVDRQQTFDVRARSLDIFGTTGNLVVAVENTGSAPTNNTVVSLSTTDATLSLRATSADIGRLGPGEVTNANFTLRVTREAAPGPHRLEVGLTYDRGDATYRPNPLGITATVPEDRNRFAVETVNGTLEPVTSNAIDVRLTNEGDAPIGDVRARIDAQSPYESDKPTAYAGDLTHGESATLTFEVSAPEDAVPGSDSFGVNISGTGQDGLTFVESDHLATVTYPPEAAAEQSMIVLIVGVVVVLIAGAWWLRH